MTSRFTCMALAGLAALGCEGSPPLDVQLVFAARVGTEEARCGVTYSHLGSTGASASLADARLYVSEIELRDVSGTWVPLELEQDGLWQHEDVVLLDFEDGSAGCAGGGTSQQNDTVRGIVPNSQYNALRFVVGVPRVLNHLDSTLAPSPMNATGMFWSWQTGYKFLRVDLLPDGDVARWNIHVGSTGCTSSASTIAPDAPCGRSNRSTVTIEDFDWERDRIAFDIGALVSDVNLGVNTPETAPGCMSMPSEADDCEPIFDALGLSFDSGACAEECKGQRVFAVGSR